MYNYVLDVYIWSFAVFGVYCIMKEFWLDIVCFFVILCVNLVDLFIKQIAKFNR